MNQAKRPQATATNAIHSHNAKATAEGMTPQFALHAVRRWWKVAAPLAILLAAASATGVWFWFSPEYKATAWIRIYENQPHLAFPSEERAKRFVTTQLELLTMPQVLQPLLEDQRIAGQPELQEAKDKLGYLRNNINVQQVNKSEIYRVEYTASDPADAKAMVDGIVRSYRDYVSAASSERRSNLMVRLEDEIESRKKRVENQQQEVRNLAQIAGIAPMELNTPFAGQSFGASDPDTQTRSLLVQTEVDLVMLQAELDYESERLEKPIEVPENQVDQAVGDQLLARQEELDTKRDQLEELKKKVQDSNNPTLQRELARLEAEQVAFDNQQKQVRARVRTQLKNQAAAARSSRLETLQTKLATAQATKKLLEERLNQDEEVSGENLTDQLRLQFANRELGQAESVCDALLQRKAQLQTEQNAPESVLFMNGGNAITSNQPVRSIPFKELLFGIGLSLCLPFGVAIGSEWIVKRINDVEEIRDQMGMDVLGEIVALPKFASNARSLKRNRSNRQLFEESVDGLRTSLVLPDATHPLRTLAITSAVSSEGKTSVATELAISMARTTKKPILLLDGDMRAPDVHRLFDLDVTPGLAEVLKGEATLDEAVKETDFAQLYTLPAGLLESSPHRLLHNGEFKKLLDEARDTFAYIIVDTPPVLAASEALVMAKHSDAALVCAMRDHSRLGHVKRAQGRLNKAGANTIGAVMSGLPARSYASRYGSYEYISADVVS